MWHLLPLILFAAFWWFNAKRGGGKAAGDAGDASPSALDFMSEVAKDIAPFLPKEAAEAFREIAEKADQAADSQRTERGETRPSATRFDQLAQTVIETAVEAALSVPPSAKKKKHKQPMPARHAHDPLRIVPPVGLSLDATDRRPRRHARSVMAIAHGRGVCSPK